MSTSDSIFSSSRWPFSRSRFSSTEEIILPSAPNPSNKGLQIFLVLVILGIVVAMFTLFVHKRGWKRLKNYCTGSPLATRGPGGPGFSTFDDPIPFSRLRENEQETSVV